MKMKITINQMNDAGSEHFNWFGITTTGLSIEQYRNLINFIEEDGVFKEEIDFRDEEEIAVEDGNIVDGAVACDKGDAPKKDSHKYLVKLKNKFLKSI